jgi:MerR family transcriptional regulator, light-induced transcriptional regulator
MAALTYPLGFKEGCEEGERPGSADWQLHNPQPEVQDEDKAIFGRLARTIEGEIIPRLLLAHKTAASLGNEVLTSFHPDELQEFGGLILGLDGARAHDFIRRKREEGRPLESIILGLLAPVASYLGTLWNADRCSFAEVAVGLSRLRQLLLELSPEFENEAPGWRHGRRALLLPTPGEHHTFGLFVVEAFFRREGWDVCGGLIDSEDEVSHLVERQWFAIAGFSLSSERFLDRLTPLIRAVRRNSCNPEIGVLVGGPLFLERPELAAAVGADASAADGRVAVHEARTLIARSAVRS